MKAAILYKPNTPLEVVEVEQQGPKAGEARVRVKAAGICHSDWHVINGDWTMPLPMVLGHEAAGIVEEVAPGVSVLVIGCGGVGLNVVQGARLAGAATIIACDLLDSKLAYAKEFGATHTINASGTSPVDFARSLTQGRGVDYAFDAIGGEATTLQIIDAIRPGGTAVIVGMAAMAVRAPITPYMMALQEKCIRGTMYGSVRPDLDFPKLVDLYMQGRLKVDELVSPTYKLEEINEGFSAPRGGQVP